MATAVQKIVLSASRDIPFNKLVLSQANVRRVKAGVSIEELAEDIAHRTLLQGLSVRPVLDADGQETGMFEVPAGGRRFRALELLVKQKRLAKTAPVPCIVREGGIAEEDSLAENVQRVALHPLDQFRAFQALRDKGLGEEEIAARFFVTSTVVKQRLRLAAVSSTLLDVYAEDGMTLEQLMAFTVTSDHARQEQVWDGVSHSYNKEPYHIRRQLTEGAVRAADRRAQFVGLDAYQAAGGAILRDLVRDVQNIADVLVDPEGALERRNHWEKTSHSLLVGAILHVLYAEADKTLAGVANFLSDPRRPIETTLRAMMTTPHLGQRGVHPVVASSARELLNKSDNERSGVLSTAMSFLGLHRDPVVATVTRRCDWRIRDLVEGEAPATLYLVVPPSDISRTKPLVRLILNQIGRRLTEELEAKGRRHRLLLMLDEFPALGRLDFFESALAFMAGYGIKSFLIAQSLNQIEKAYGQNNSILDNCHVRVNFATNDERTAKRVSDALGTATEMRAMKNYAGHRLSPWLGHLMVSRQETARPLLTPGEVMQLPHDDELVLVSGCHPIRAKKARYFEDPQMKVRILPPPTPASSKTPPGPVSRAAPQGGDWSNAVVSPSATSATEDPANAGIRREPELPEHEEIVPEVRKPVQEFEPMDDEPDDEVQRQRIMRRNFGTATRQTPLDRADDLGM
jgi:ParB/RepB/Spo0J family partition protein